MRGVLVALALALSVSNAAALRTTFGSFDCGQWFTKSVTARTWFLGYLSGMGSADSSEVDVLDRLNSADQAFLWMDNYCKANPLKQVGDGAIKLYIELRDRK